jgi:hypothetical protein
MGLMLIWLIPLYFGIIIGWLPAIIFGVLGMLLMVAVALVRMSHWSNGKNKNE